MEILLSLMAFAIVKNQLFEADGPFRPNTRLPSTSFTLGPGFNSLTPNLLELYRKFPAYNRTGSRLVDQGKVFRRNGKIVIVVVIQDEHPQHDLVLHLFDIGNRDTDILVFVVYRQPCLAHLDMNVTASLRQDVFQGLLAVPFRYPNSMVASASLALCSSI